MTRRAVVLTLVLTASLSAQDEEWVRGWEAMQRQRPRTLTAVSRIAPRGEPGTPLVIHGRVFRPDGRTPAPNVTVFAYQTDRTGVYGAPAFQSRLRGWALTDRQGRFTFHTIRPGSYPSRTEPAHVHFTIEGAGLPRQTANDLQFADDPLVSASHKRRSARLGRFGGVRTVTVRDGVQHVDFLIRIDDGGRF